MTHYTGSYDASLLEVTGFWSSFDSDLKVLEYL